MSKKMRKYVAILLIVMIISNSQFITGSSLNNNYIPKFIIPESGCAIDINLDTLIMTVYMDGNIFKTYPVSGGTKETPSPIGVWYVSKITDWGEGFGGSWIGLDVPWGVYGIHGTKKPWLVGQRLASHGCIRMKNKDANELKSLVIIGTMVQIKQESLPFRNMGKGMTGSDIYNAQIMLEQLGFYTGMVNGIFGEEMELAVKSFQSTYSLNDNGIIGKKTYDVIVEQNCIIDCLTYHSFNFQFFSLVYNKIKIRGLIELYPHVI